jgi:hypothetical protein
MKLKLKREYLEHSIGGGKLIKRKFKNIHADEYEYYWNLGYTEYFIVEKEKAKAKEIELIEEKEIEDDTDKPVAD